MFDRRLLRHLDYSLLTAVVLLMLFGLIMVTSASRTAPVAGDSLYFAKRQATWIVLGLVVMVIAMSVDYASLPRLANLIYIGNLCLLVAVLLVGQRGGGAQRWIQLGPFPLQPSESAKLALIITLAYLLSKREEPLSRWWEFIPPAIHMAVPMLLVLRQPDLGTSLVFLAILFGVLWMSGANHRILLGGYGAGLAVAVGAIIMHLRYGLSLPLKGYQLKRLVAFLSPEADPLGAGYHLIQSKAALGSGRLIGQGLFQGTQNQLNFLPEQHTDFIFSVIGEELGFLGALVVIALFLFILTRLLSIVLTAKDSFGALLVAGAVSMLAFHILLNIGMTVGAMPVTGIPLPFLSYGGSSLLTNCALIGLALNVNMRRQKILF